jgi:hypothetical protein
VIVDGTSAGQHLPLHGSGSSRNVARNVEATQERSRYFNYFTTLQLKWWTRSQPIRTVAELSLSFPLLETRPPFAYQYLAERASELWRLGMSACVIARALGVSDKTITKTLRYRVKTEHLTRGE